MALKHLSPAARDLALEEGAPLIGDTFMARELSWVGGFHERPGMRSEHGEAETRFYHTMAHDIPKDGRKALASSSDADAAIIGALGLTSDLLQNRIHHIVGSEVIDMRKLKGFCDLHDLSLRTLACLCALSGCDFAPGAAVFSKLSFARRFFSNRHIIGGLSSLSSATRMFLALRFMKPNLGNALPSPKHALDSPQISAPWEVENDREWNREMRRRIFHKTNPIRTAADLLQCMVI